MDYPCMEVADSFECYQFLRANLIKKLQDSKQEILVFEDRMTEKSNIIVCVVKKNNKSKEQAVFMALIRLTIMMEPKIGFCHIFDVTSKLVS